MRPISVLLVDDNRCFLDVLSRYLQAMGEGEVQVVGAVSDGREAVARALATQPEVVCLDLHMPGLSGMSLLPRLREAMPLVTIVVVTTQDQEYMRQRTLAMGADGFVAKEDITNDLLPTIRDLVAHTHGPGEAAPASRPKHVPRNP